MNWVDTIADWQTHPVEDGYAGLHDLADAGFSGGISTDDTWLLFVNGTAVSVTDHSDGSPTPGDIERFEDAPLAAHEAPHPSVPLLAAMQFGDSETRGKYYTEETPLSEVETTLDDGGFTGYVELSENVLSGDYYTVYQGGQSTHIAFVGNSSSLKTDDDAREAAHDEVGLYEVVAAPIGVVELPDAPEPDEEPEPTTVATPADAAASEESDIDPEPSDTQSEPDTPTETPVEAEEEPESNVDDSVATEPDEEVATDEPTGDESATDEPTTATDSTVAESDDESTDVPPEPTATSDVEKEATTTAVSESTMDSEPTDSGARSPSSAISRVSEPDEELASDEPDEEPTSDELHAGASASNASSSSPPSKTTSVTEQLAARSIPSVDPERTTDHSDQTKPSRPSHTSRQRQPRKQQSTREQADTQPESETPDAVSEELEAARESLATAETERDDARTELETAREELAAAETAREELEAERDDLQREVESLRTRVEELESQLGDVATDGPSLSAREALDGTNIFVRYESKGKITVESAHDGDGTPAELAQNLRLVHHTQFETDGATVDGQPFEQWLYDTQQYRFTEWLIGQLVFEIRETETTSTLSELYDALPATDRIELDGAVAVPEGNEEVDIEFDIVCRDRMGDPLFVANLDASRQPISDGQMASLVQDSGLVCETEATFTGAFFVSAAFFEPGALETARDATSGSLLSRDSRLSYVKQSRKRGYHLALVESRDDGFHLSVPNL